MNKQLGGRHPYEWGKTQNFFVYLNNHLRLEHINEMFLETPVFATEKIDGTNLSIDVDAETLFSRRRIIDKKNKFNGVRPDNVWKSPVTLLKDEVISIANLCQSSIKNFIVYGELVDKSGLYDYNARPDVNRGMWYVFAIRIVPTTAAECDHIVEKLSTAGFTTNNSSTGGSGNGIITLYLNDKLYDTVKNAGLHVPPVMKGGNILQVIKNNIHRLNQNVSEGIVLMLPTFKLLLKLKSHHQYQPTGHACIIELSSKVDKSVSIDEQVKLVFKNLVEYITPEQCARAPPRYIKSPPGYPLSQQEKQLVFDGLHHVQNKSGALVETAVAAVKKKDATFESVDDLKQQFLNEVYTHVITRLDATNINEQMLNSFIKEQIDLIYY